MESISSHLAQAKKLLAETPLIGKYFTSDYHCIPTIVYSMQHMLIPIYVDGHNDFPFMIRGWHLGKMGDVDARSIPIAHTDLVRLRKGCVGGVFWSAYVPWYEVFPNVQLLL